MKASPTDLRRMAAVLDSTREELDGHRVAASGPLSVPIEADPEWAAAAALRALGTALDDGLALVSQWCGATAEAMRSAAGAYEAADDRAARRLVAARGRPW